MKLKFNIISYIILHFAYFYKFVSIQNYWNQCIHNLKNIQMVSKQKRSKSSEKKASSTIQRKQEYVK
jgi:hypothetical protein